MSDLTRRDVLSGLAVASLAVTETRPAQAQGTAPAPAAVGPRPGDAVWLCNEDSNTLTVIDPTTNEVAATVNLTSFDEDPRPPFRFVTGGVIPPHGAMIQKPLYHGAISIHGACPSPDSRLAAGSPALVLPAALGALAAAVLVTIAAIAVHKPLSRVPENTLKFAVGVIISAFGIFWTGEGLGIAWPGEDLALFGIAAVLLAAALAGVRLAAAPRLLREVR